MSRKIRKPQESRTKGDLAREVVAKRMSSELEEESVAERLRQNVKDHGSNQRANVSRTPKMLSGIFSHPALCR
jgi:hypothetical protein